MDFKDFEDFAARSKVADVPIGKMWRRRYNVPAAGLGLVPKRGDLMPGYVLAAGESVLYVPYVTNVQHVQAKDTEKQGVVLTFTQAEESE